MSEWATRLKLATVWLGGCSGCHMSFLDLDEWLIELAEQVDLVFTPLVDAKEYPDEVDVALVEGAVGNEEHLEMIQHDPRAQTKILVSFGDCAVTGNVTVDAQPARRRADVLRRGLRGERRRSTPRIPRPRSSRCCSTA